MPSAQNEDATTYSDPKEGTYMKSPLESTFRSQMAYAVNSQLESSVGHDSSVTVEKKAQLR